MIRTTGYTGENTAREYASSRESGEADATHAVTRVSGA